MQCQDNLVLIGCRRAANGAPLGAVTVFYELRKNALGNIEKYATRYADAEGVPFALAAGETVSIGVCPVPYASEKITYALGGNEYQGWKQFFYENGVSAELIRDPNGAIVVGAVEVTPATPVTTVTPSVEYNTNGIDIVAAGATKVYTGFHSVTVTTANATADVTINGVTVNQPAGTSLTWEATGLLANSVSVTGVTGTTIIQTTK